MKARRSLTEQDKSFIRANYLVLNADKLSAHTGSSVSSIRTFFRSENIYLPNDVRIRFRAGGMVGKTTFTPAEDAIIRANYLTVPIKRLGDTLLNGRSYTGIMTRLRQMGLTIPAEIIEQRKKDSRIQIGDEPVNKGRKQSEWMSADNIAKTAATRFKKGQTPHNTRSDMEISVRADTKTGIHYHYIRVACGDWQLLQRYNYQKFIGDIPEGCLIAFKDGDQSNCHPFNLMLLSQAENAIRNSGTIRLTNGTVAMYMATKSRKVDHDLKEEILTNYPNLIQLKRNQLLLNRAIKEHGKK